MRAITPGCASTATWLQSATGRDDLTCQIDRARMVTRLIEATHDYPDAVAFVSAVLELDRKPLDDAARA